MKSPRRKRQRVQIGSFSSVGARLFFFMIAVVVIATAINTFQAFKSFSEFFSDNYQKTAEEDAEAVATQIDVLINSWQQHLAQAAGVGPNFETPETTESIRELLATNGDFINVQFFKVSANGVTALSKPQNTARIKDYRFEDKNPAKIFRDLEKEIRTEVNKRRTSLVRRPYDVINLSSDIELPVAAIVTGVGPLNQNVIGVLTVWQSAMIKGMPRHKFLKSYIVDRRGRVVFSPLSGILNQPKPIKTDLVRSLWKSKNLTGFRSAYTGIDGESYSGAFAKLEIANSLAAVVEYQDNLFFAMIRDSVTTTTLLFWASFVILAMAFSFWFAAQLKGDIAYLSNYTSRLADGDFSHPARPRRRDELGVLTEDMNDIAGGISKMINEQIEITAMEKEIQTSKFMKSTLSPKGDVLSKDLFISGFYRPAALFGGDLWGHLKLSGNRDLFFIGDAAGTGTQASIVVSMAYAACKAMENQLDREEATPAEVLHQLNRVVYQAVKGSVCMTFLIGIFDQNRGTFTYSNAGHNLPLLVPIDKKDERLSQEIVKPGLTGKDFDLFTIHQSSVPVGIQSKPDYRDHVVPLKPGDKFFFYSDGLVECQSPEGVSWGEKTLGEQILDLAKLPASEIRDEIKRRAFRFFNNRPLDDDVTIVAAEVKRSWQPSTSAAPRPSAGLSFSSHGAAAANLGQPAIGLPLPDQSDLNPIEKVAYHVDSQVEHDPEHLPSNSHEEEVDGNLGSDIRQLASNLPQDLDSEIIASGIPLPKMEEDGISQRSTMGINYDVFDSDDLGASQVSPLIAEARTDSNPYGQAAKDIDHDLIGNSSPPPPTPPFKTGFPDVRAALNAPIQDAIEVNDTEEMDRLSKEFESQNSLSAKHLGSSVSQDANPHQIASEITSDQAPNNEVITSDDSFEVDHNRLTNDTNASFDKGPDTTSTEQRFGADTPDTDDNPFRTDDLGADFTTPPPPKMVSGVHELESGQKFGDDLEESNDTSSMVNAEIPPAPPLSMFGNTDESRLESQVGEDHVIEDSITMADQYSTSEFNDPQALESHQDSNTVSDDNTFDNTDETPENTGSIELRTKKLSKLQIGKVAPATTNIQQTPPSPPTDRQAIAKKTSRIKLK